MKKFGASERFRLARSFVDPKLKIRNQRSIRTTPIQRRNLKDPRDFAIWISLLQMNK